MRHARYRRRPDAALAALSVTGALTIGLAIACSPAPVAEWTATDSAAVVALEDAYVSGWVRNDRPAVLATLHEDAVLLPGGLPPVQGLDAMEAFWWPPEGPTTTVTAYRTTIEELGGSGPVAYVRGRGDLSFTWEEADGDRGERTSRSVFLMVARRGPDGEWRIANRMWHSLPE